MKKSTLAVAALLTSLSAATIVPAAYAADDINGAQVASCSGNCAAKSSGCAAKSSCCAAKSTSTAPCAPAPTDDNAS